jgi:hypothetical protein
MVEDVNPCGDRRHLAARTTNEVAASRILEPARIPFAAARPARPD